MSTLVAQTISNGTVSTSSTNVIQGSAKAWVQSSGTAGGVLASYNVSSVTRRTTGQYTVSFTNAFTDTNYTVAGMVGIGGTGNGLFLVQDTASKTTTQVFIVCRNIGNAIVDPDFLSVVCNR
jgi:hypothetical protein